MPLKQGTRSHFTGLGYILAPNKDKFRDIINDLQNNQGFSPQEAYERATAFVLKESGVSLLKSNSIPVNFKKIGLEQVKNPDGPEYGARMKDG